MLKNIHYHPENATTLYKAELKLKHAALMQLKGVVLLVYILCTWTSRVSEAVYLVNAVCIVRVLGAGRGAGG